MPLVLGPSPWLCAPKPPHGAWVHSLGTVAWAYRVHLAGPCLYRDRSGRAVPAVCQHGLWNAPGFSGTRPACLPARVRPGSLQRGTRPARRIQGVGWHWRVRCRACISIFISVTIFHRARAAGGGGTLDAGAEGGGDAARRRGVEEGLGTADCQLPTGCHSFCSALITHPLGHSSMAMLHAPVLYSCVLRAPYAHRPVPKLPRLCYAGLCRISRQLASVNASKTLRKRASTFVACRSVP